MDELDGFREDCRFVCQWNAGINIQHVRTGGNLGQGISLYSTKVSCSHFSSEDFPTSRVDPFADDDERPLEADDDFLGVRTDYSIGHGLILFGSQTLVSD